MTGLDEYQGRYSHIALSRDDGVLEVRLHSGGGPLVWGMLPHDELGACFTDIAADRENRVVVITGTGDRFITEIDDSFAGPMTADRWHEISAAGRRLLTNLLDIPVPVVAAVNGPARVHAELAVLADVVIASEDADFQDAPHFRYGTVPGDGVHVVWPLLLGPNRGRAFLLTGQRIRAREALTLGLVAEVVAPGKTRERARELARDLARQPDLTLRSTRALLTYGLRRALLAELEYGLALEGLVAQTVWPSGQGS